MKLAILYPTGVFYDGRAYTTDAYQHYQFPYLAPHFDGLDLVVLLKRTTTERGREVMGVSGTRVLGLPYCGNGWELHITRLPLWLFALVRLMWRHRREWDRVLLYDITLPNQVAYVLCRLFGLKAVLLLGGRYPEGFWQAHRDDMWLLRAPAWLYACWVRVVERHLVRRVPTLADYVPEGLKRGAQERFSFYVGAMIEERELEAPRPPRGDGTLRLLSVGRVVPIKGYEYLIEAVALLRQRGAAVSLDIVGPLYGRHYGGYEDKLRALIRDRGLGDVVSLRGAIPFGPKLMAAYREADVFVLSSLSEGIPKVLCEAMAKALPIVATRVGGIPWLMEQTRAGLLVEPGDSQGLAEAMLEAHQRREELGRRAFQAAFALTAPVQMKAVADFIRQLGRQVPDSSRETVAP